MYARTPHGPPGIHASHTQNNPSSRTASNMAICSCHIHHGDKCLRHTCAASDGDTSDIFGYTRTHIFNLWKSAVEYMRQKCSGMTIETSLQKYFGSAACNKTTDENRFDIADNGADRRVRPTASVNGFRRSTPDHSQRASY